MCTKPVHYCIGTTPVHYCTCTKPVYNCTSTKPVCTKLVQVHAYACTAPIHTSCIKSSTICSLSVLCFRLSIRSNAWREHEMYMIKNLETYHIIILQNKVKKYTLYTIYLHCIHSKICSTRQWKHTFVLDLRILSQLNQQIIFYTEVPVHPWRNHTKNSFFYRTT